MAEQPKINEKHIAEFVSDQKTASDSGYCFTADIKKRPQADRHLENTLVNNIGSRESLTKREVQILRSILAGNTNKQIALMLSRSRRTIEYHRNRLMRKLDARNTVELVKRAVAMGIA